MPREPLNASCLDEVVNLIRKGYYTLPTAQFMRHVRATLESHAVDYSLAKTYLDAAQPLASDSARDVDDAVKGLEKQLQLAVAALVAVVVAIAKNARKGD